MKNVFLFLLVACSVKSFSQGTIAPIPNLNTGRFDIIYFINDAVGWAMSGSNSEVYSTTDAGASWKLHVKGKKHSRSIEYLTPTLGFYGSPDSSFYATRDSGITWTEMHNIKVSPNPASDFLTIEITIKNKTACQLILLSADGKVLESIYEGSIEKGRKNFSLPLEYIYGKLFYVVLKTNEGLTYRKVIKD